MSVEDSDALALAVAAHLAESGAATLDPGALALALRMVAAGIIDPQHSFTALLVVLAAHGARAPPPPPAAAAAVAAPPPAALPPLAALAAYASLAHSHGALCAPPEDVFAATIPAIAALFAGLPDGARAPLRAVFVACLRARPPALPSPAPCCGGALLGAAAAAVGAAGAAAAACAGTAAEGAEALAAAMAEAAALCAPIATPFPLARGDAEVVAARATPAALRCLGLAVGLLQGAPPLPPPLRAMLHGAGRALQERIMDLMPSVLAGS